MTNPICTNQASAWNSLLTDNNKTTGGSHMRNMQQTKQQKIVEISFNPESEDPFPYTLRRDPEVTPNHEPPANTKTNLTHHPPHRLKETQ
jgi:hypothetical protein